MTILEQYQQLHAGSIKLYEDSLKTFPSGVTHDVRLLTPSPIYVDRAQGSHKWDVDGNDIIDYVMGHGALILGHSHPSLVKAITGQISKGTHYGANHKLELDWSKLVKELIPSAEAVRFTSSGTEATQMAVRLARAYTGRDKILKFDYNFHGWTDTLVGKKGVEGDSLYSSGIPGGTLNNTVSVPQNDLELVKAQLEKGDVAAVILEPTGASWGTLPLPESFLHSLSKETKRHDTLLIFDEVITGWGRMGSAFGSQEFGVTPDLMTMAKATTNGIVPMGVVACKEEIYDAVMDASPKGTIELFHGYTYSGIPVSVAAALAVQEIFEKDDIFNRAKDLTPYFQEAIFSLKDMDVVENIRGYGMMAGVDIKMDQKPGRAGFTCFKHCYEVGVNFKATGDCLIIAPMFISEKKHIDEIIEKLRTGISNYSKSKKN